MNKSLQVKTVYIRKKDVLVFLIKTLTLCGEAVFITHNYHRLIPYHYIYHYLSSFISLRVAYLWSRCQFFVHPLFHCNTIFTTLAVSSQFLNTLLCYDANHLWLRLSPFRTSQFLWDVSHGFVDSRGLWQSLEKYRIEMSLRVLMEKARLSHEQKSDVTIFPLTQILWYFTP
jgi:hypothetical protein